LFAVAERGIEELYVGRVREGGCVGVTPE
jgi:hypothetical protein